MAFETAGYRISHSWEIAHWGQFPMPNWPTIMFRAVHAKNKDTGFDLDLTALNDRTIAEHILTVYAKGTVVYDPVAGKGAMGIASIKHNCIFYGCEIHPRICSIALKELVKRTGKQPIKYTEQ